MMVPSAPAHSAQLMHGGWFPAEAGGKPPPLQMYPPIGHVAEARGAPSMNKAELGIRNAFRNVDIMAQLRRNEEREAQRRGHGGSRVGGQRVVHVNYV